MLTNVPGIISESLLFFPALTPQEVLLNNQILFCIKLEGTYRYHLLDNIKQGSIEEHNVNVHWLHWADWTKRDLKALLKQAP